MAIDASIIISLFPPFIAVCLRYQLFGLISTVYTFNAIRSFAIVSPFTTMKAIAFERYLVTNNRRAFYNKHCTKCTVGFIVLLTHLVIFLIMGCWRSFLP